MRYALAVKGKATDFVGFYRDATNSEHACSEAYNDSRGSRQVRHLYSASAPALKPRSSTGRATQARPEIPRTIPSLSAPSAP